MLTIGHYLQADLPCGATSGCATVANDPSSFFLGIPVALYGLGAYFLIQTLAVLKSVGKAPPWSSAFSLLVTSVGVSVSLWLTYHALFALGTSCMWCLSSAADMTLLLGAQLGALKVRHQKISAPLRKGLFGAGCAVIAVAAVGATAKLTFKPTKLKINLASFIATPASILAPTNAHRIGSPSAPVTIVEFADLGCPACKMMNARFMKFLPTHPEVQLVFRQYPLSILHGHENSYPAAILTEQVGEGQFWRLIDQFYSVPGELDAASYSQISAGVTSKPISKQDAEARVKVDLALAHRLGLEQTPTYLILTPTAKVAAGVNDLLQKLKEPQISRYLRRT